MKPILRNLVKICVPIAVYILVWKLLSMLVDSSLLLPSPKTVFSACVQILSSSAGWKTIGASLLRILSGYLLGCLFGVLLAVLTARFKTLNWMLSPLRSLIKTTPITSFALILLISVVSNVVPVLVAMIVVIPMIWKTTEEAILGLDPQLDEMANVYFRPFKKMYYVELPQILPHFFAAASTALGFAWKAVITAEILSLPKLGIGRQMQNDKLYLDIPELFAWTLLVILFSVCVEALLKLALKRAGRRTL